MRKLTLDPEMLAVETFVADEAADDGAGTVRGHSFVTVNDRPCGGDDPSAQCMDTDYHVYTCGVSCINMCFHTGVQAGCID